MTNALLRSTALALVITVGGLAIMIAGFAEILLAIPLPVWFYATAASLVFLLAAIRRGRSTGIAAAVFIVGLLALHQIPWTTRKPFLRQLHGIRPGMTETQVRSIMFGYQEGTGWPVIPGPESPPTTTAAGNGNLTMANALVFRHSDDGRFNSDWGVIEFKAGRVSRVQFLPD